MVMRWRKANGAGAGARCGAAFGNTGFDAAYLRTRSAGAGRGSSAVYATELRPFCRRAGGHDRADARAAMQDNEVKQSATPISMTRLTSTICNRPRAIQLKARCECAIRTGPRAVDRGCRLGAGSKFESKRRPKGGL